MKVKDRKKSQYNRNMHGSLKMKQMYEHLKENGDLVRAPDQAARKEKQGELDYRAFQLKKQQAELTRQVTLPDKPPSHGISSEIAWKRTSERTTRTSIARSSSWGETPSSADSAS